MRVQAIELRDVDATESCYDVFKKMHENVCYAEISPELEVPRTPIIKSFKEYKSFLEQSNVYFIIAEDVVIGYIIMDAFYDDVLHEDACKIQEMFIKQDFQKKGYGKKAIKQLIHELSGTEYSVIKVFSATIATDNFYSSCNFRYVSGDVYEYRLK